MILTQKQSKGALLNALTNLIQFKIESLIRKALIHDDYVSHGGT